MSKFVMFSAKLRLVIALVMFQATMSVAWGQTAVRPGRLSKEETAALQSGWVATFATPEKNADPLDARRLRVAALHVPAGTSPSSFFPDGPFVARLSGWLKVPLKGEYTLRLHARGAVSMQVNGQQVLSGATTATIELVKGYNRFDISLRSLSSGEATVRVYWSSADFIEEPLPTDLLFSRSDDPLLMASRELRKGRELFAARHCLQCHALDKVATNNLAMPELQDEAPRLVDLGKRLQSDWLQAWIVNPHRLRSTATMPALLTGSESEQQQAAADLAAYLVSLSGDVKSEILEVAPTEEVLESGGKLFENLGCIACHHLQPATHNDPYDRLSLHFVKAKFAPGALAAFLQAPQKHYAWSRMPDFRLSKEESTALAGFLISKTKGEVTSAKGLEGSAKRGEKLFSSLNCAQCHSLGTAATPSAKNVALLPTQPTAKGCLASERDPVGKSPDFHWNDSERAALLRFLQSDRQSLTRETPAEFSVRQVEQLRCAVCHRRDGAGSVLSAVLLDESSQGLTPEILPSLSWTGEKLQPEWSQRLLAGEQTQTARPWLRARMPSFHARAALLSLGLSHEHGFAADENPQPKHDVELATVGEQLAADNGGLACIKCHAVGERPALAPFEAPGINLVDAAHRLRYSYYLRWMHDPPRIDVATKMPKFSADGRKTSVSHILDGNADKQYEALWHYIQTLPRNQHDK